MSPTAKTKRQRRRELERQDRVNQAELALQDRVNQAELAREISGICARIEARRALERMEDRAEKAWLRSPSIANPINTEEIRRRRRARVNQLRKDLP